MELFKYQGAGNDFLIADNREGHIMIEPGQIAGLCDRRYGFGADGFMILENSDQASFRMEYWNSDGSGGMMCGNGGRCIAAFALDLGISDLRFEAPDGMHEAESVSHEGRCRTIRLGMKDVNEIVSYVSGAVFMNTGTRHLVLPAKGLAGNYPVRETGRKLRWETEFAPEGTNVNFMEPDDGFLRIRTFEKGVEDETFACGTGITASAVAAYLYGIIPHATDGNRVTYRIRAVRDGLSVDFIPRKSEFGIAGPYPENGFTDECTWIKKTEPVRTESIHLTGPAVFVGRIII